MDNKSVQQLPPRTPILSSGDANKPTSSVHRASTDANAHAAVATSSAFNQNPVATPTYSPASNPFAERPAVRTSAGATATFMLSAAGLSTPGGRADGGGGGGGGSNNNSNAVVNAADGLLAVSPAPSQTASNYLGTPPLAVPGSSIGWDTPGAVSGTAASTTKPRAHHEQPQQQQPQQQLQQIRARPSSASASVSAAANSAETASEAASSWVSRGSRCSSERYGGASPAELLRKAASRMRAQAAVGES